MKSPRSSLIVRWHDPAKHSAFTIVEMLVVFSIMLVLVGLASITVSRSGRANSLTNAGNQLVAMVRLARQNSMTRNALTAIVIPSGKDNWNSYILYELASRTDGSRPTTADWRPISKWETLPPAVVFDDCEFISRSVPKEFPDLPAIVPTGGTAASNYHYIVFTPSGGLYPFSAASAGGPNQATENPALRIVEGIRLGDDVSDISYTGLKSGDRTNFYRVTVLSTTGTPKIDRL